VPRSGPFSLACGATLRAWVAGEGETRSRAIKNTGFSSRREHGGGRGRETGGNEE